MKLTRTTIRAVAEAYSPCELRELLKKAVARLEAADAIVSATTGGGASYTREQRIDAAQQVELYQMALDYKQGVTANDDASGLYPVVFCGAGKL